MLRRKDSTTSGGPPNMYGPFSLNNNPIPNSWLLDDGGGLEILISNNGTLIDKDQFSFTVNSSPVNNKLD